MMDYEERIARWLSGDPGLADGARSIAVGVPVFTDLNPLRIWATNLLFDPGYGVVVDDLLWVSNRGADVNEAAVVRAEIGPVLFSVANWTRVAEKVKAYTDKEM
jgi:hypothetical protein